MIDWLALAFFIGSMLIVGRIAGSQGRRITPWVWTAAVIGPLAIPLLFLVRRELIQEPRH
jgi:hypothetical protein